MTTPNQRVRLRPMKLAAMCAAACAPVISALLSLACGGEPAPSPDVAADRASEPAARISVVSGPPDLISGGDALIRIELGDGVAPADLAVTVGARSVTAAFAPELDRDARALSSEAPGGRDDARGSVTLVGLVTGLEPGAQRIEVSANGARIGSLEVVDHARQGPLFSGPHQTPFLCQTAENGLGDPLDETCAAETRVSYVYKSSEPRVVDGGGDDGPAALRRDPTALPPGFEPFDPDAPRPSDVATTITSTGETVDFIVRRERGTINRAVYEIAMLHVPGEPLPGPSRAGRGWNGRLVYSFGGGCAAGYRQGLLRPMLQVDVLAKGYAIAGSSLNVFGNTCNDVVSAETALMVREHFVEQFGEPVHTIGSGGSGGSMQQHLIAQNYPGILDGITPVVSFPEHLAVLSSSADCSLLSAAFDAAGEDAFTEEQRRAISGFATWRVCGQAWTRSILQRSRCDAALPGEWPYDAESNPAGARCSTHDNMVNMFGRDPETGFALRPLDNVGVQYGLVALRDGSITMDAFLDLNARIGGHDRDGNIVSERTRADVAALRAAYRGGRLNTGGGDLARIPIIDYRFYTDPLGDIHDSYRSFVTRARIAARTGGSTDHHVMLRLPLRPRAPDGSRPDPPFDAITLMDRWLTALDADTSADERAIKLLRARPAELVDACWTNEGEKIAEPQQWKTGRCAQLYPSAGDPRIAAGAPLRDDILKCQLRPIDLADYPTAPTDAQLERLREIFPDGVCDYSAPGVEQGGEPALWARY